MLSIRVAGLFHGSTRKTACSIFHETNVSQGHINLSGGLQSPFQGKKKKTQID